MVLELVNSQSNRTDVPDVSLIAKGKGGGSSSKRSSSDESPGFYKAKINKLTVTPSVNGINGAGVGLQVPVTQGVAIDVNSTLNCNGTKSPASCIMTSGIGININQNLGNNTELSISGEINSSGNRAAVGIKYEKDQEK